MTALSSPLAEREGDRIDLAAGGDEAAFTRIVADHHDDMLRVSFVVCGDADLAEEAVAAAWLIAWRKLGDLREPDRLRPWLVSIAVNEARQAVRRRRRRPRPSDRPQANGARLVTVAVASMATTRSRRSRRTSRRACHRDRVRRRASARNPPGTRTERDWH